MSDEIQRFKSWTQWMGQAQAGDRLAYTRLFEEVGPYVYRILGRKMAGRPQVEDVVQEVLLTIHRARHTYDNERPFRPWLHAIVESRLMDFWRKQKRREASEFVSEEGVLPEQEAPLEFDAIDIEDFQKALAELSQTQKDVVMMIKLEGLSIKQVSEKLSLSESAVKVTAHRGYKKLFEVLGG